MKTPELFRFMRSTTARLAASYLAIIMVMSIGFSLVFYYTCIHELNTLVPRTSAVSTENQPVSVTDSSLLNVKIYHASHALLNKLILLNLLALIGGAFLSYYLTRRTLLPIENAMEAQSRFVTDASHEMRTPLTAMLASNEVALRKQNLTLSGARDIIKSNTEEVIKLKDLSDGLLKLAKLDNGLMLSKKASLQDIAGEAMNHVIRAAQVKQISIEDSVPEIMVLGDMPSLVQAIVVLLDNAIKYSPRKSIIYLEGHKKDKHGYLNVIDEGSGISPSDLPHVFERFYRSDVSRSKTATSGYGIGLSIAKKIVEQHHGKITVSSVLNQGSSFVIELPLSL